MIGNRRRRPRLAVPLGVAGALLLGLLFALRPADPAAADPATASRLNAAVAAQAAEADAALHRLKQQLERAIDAGRAGAAATVTGDDPPRGRLAEAADRLAAAREPLRGARDSLGRLAGLLAARPTATPPTLSLSVEEVEAVAAQLRSTAPAADAFAAMRHATADVLSLLQDALVALDGGRPSDARAAADAGLKRLDEIRPWESRLDTISIWIDTTDSLLSSLRDVAAAQLDHDVAAERRARQAYARAAESATRADRARAIAISEGGGDVTAAALAAAAALLERVDATIATLAPLVHA